MSKLAQLNEIMQSNPGISRTFLTYLQKMFTEEQLDEIKKTLVFNPDDRTVEWTDGDDSISVKYGKDGNPDKIKIINKEDNFKETILFKDNDGKIKLKHKKTDKTDKKTQKDDGTIVTTYKTTEKTTIKADTDGDVSYKHKTTELNKTNTDKETVYSRDTHTKSEKRKNGEITSSEKETSLYASKKGAGAKSKKITEIYDEKGTLIEQGTSAYGIALELLGVKMSVEKTKQLGNEDGTQQTLRGGINIDVSKTDVKVALVGEDATRDAEGNIIDGGTFGIGAKFGFLGGIELGGFSKTVSDGKEKNVEISIGLSKDKGIDATYKNDTKQITDGKTDKTKSTKISIGTGKDIKTDWNASLETSSTTAEKDENGNVVYRKDNEVVATINSSELNASLVKNSKNYSLDWEKGKFPKIKISKSTATPFIEASIINENTTDSTRQYTEIDGKKHGTDVTYDTSGQATSVKLYNHGNEISVSENDSVSINNIKNKEGTLTFSTYNGNMFGTAIKQDTNGKISSTFYDLEGEIAPSEKATVHLEMKTEDNPKEIQNSVVSAVISKKGNSR